MSTQKIIFGVFILTIVDQVVKIIINNFFFECQFEIIPSLFEFKPIFNDKHSYVNDLLYKNFNINMGLWFHIVLFLFIEFVILTLYFNFKKIISKNQKLLDLALVFQLAGVVCALLGNLVWKEGTLDFIYLKPLFVFDFKDLYIDCFVVLFMIYVHKNYNEIKMIKMKDMTLDLKHLLKKEQ